jgi:ATP-dependent exoDNAse (exonuclease V) beta subunit
VVKRGRRVKKHETVQLYLCKTCEKTFTPQIVKHKHYPLGMILDAVSLYNLGYTRNETCQLIKEKYGPSVKPSTLTKWIEELAPLCRYARFRDLAQELYSPYEIIKSITLNHQQVYQYRYHQAKLDILFEQKDFSQEKFQDLKIFLTLIEKYCPHDYFQSGSRSSKAGAGFDLEKVIIKQKQNHATRLAQLVLQAVGHNRLRHEALQQFMLANDSVTVAIEVPIFLTPQDIKHLTKKLRFHIPLKPTEILTGHIDILQIRNGLVHILDYKPNAKREKPYSQLTSYALALSRLTGLKLMDFKCAWFDEHHYYEFFPLHIVHKR